MKQILKETEDYSRKTKEELRERYDELIRIKDKRDQANLWDDFILLEEAYPLGKKVHGLFYTMDTLALDFNMSRDGVKRILSLRNMNEETKILVKKGKIDLRKVALITFERNGDQDTLVKATIEHNLTQFQIRNYVIDCDDVGLTPQFKNAIEVGYTRKQNALSNVISNINRQHYFLKIDIKSYPKNEKDYIIEQYELLWKRIGQYLEKYK